MNPVFEQLESTLASTLDGLDAQQMQLRSTVHPGKWSIQQIVEHLLLTYSSTCHVVGVRLLKGTPTRSRSSPWQHLARFCVTRLGYFPAKRPATEPVIPPTAPEPLDCEHLMALVHQQLSALDSLCDEAQVVFGNRRAITHGVLGPINIEQWRIFHLLHSCHHTKQIAAIRREHRI